jgi:hypothetical protein
MANRAVRKRRQSGIADAKPPEAWVDREVADCEFKDERLGKRFRSLLAQLSLSPGDSIPLVCQDWANTKAAYRFFDNDRVSEVEILGGHFQAKRERAAATDGPILVMHDTTEFSYKREDTDAIGKTRINIAGAYRDGMPRYITACGILMHSSLAVTSEDVLASGNNEPLSRWSLGGVQWSRANVGCVASIACWRTAMSCPRLSSGG